MTEAILKLIKWEEEPMAQKNSEYPINKVHAEYEVSGELAGCANVEYFLYYINEDGHNSTALISGIFTFTGTFNGEHGKFVASENGRFDKGVLMAIGIIIHAENQLSYLRGSYKYAFDSRGLLLQLELI